MDGWIDGKGREGESERREKEGNGKGGKKG